MVQKSADDVRVDLSRRHLLTALIVAWLCGGWFVAGVKQHELDGLNGYIDALIARMVAHPVPTPDERDAFRRAVCAPFRM